MARLARGVRYVYLCFLCVYVHVYEMTFSSSFSTNPMETRPQVLFGLGVVVGPAGLFQLVAEIILLQLSGITYHELLGKVLHEKKYIL